MIKEFQDSGKRIAHDSFQLWRRSNEGAYFLTMKTARKANLHGALCNHAGGTEWHAVNGSESLTKARKITSDDVGELRNWAKARGIEVKDCLHCQALRLLP